MVVMVVCRLRLTYNCFHRPGRRVCSLPIQTGWDFRHWAGKDAAVTQRDGQIGGWKVSTARRELIPKHQIVEKKERKLKGEKEEKEARFKIKPSGLCDGRQVCT